MSQFAAGCAICGADLEAHRRRQAQRRVKPEALVPSVSRPRMSDDTLALLITGMMVSVFPLLGLLVVALQVNKPERAEVRTQLLLLGAVAIAFVLFPPLRYGVIALMYGAL